MQVYCAPICGLLETKMLEIKKEDASKIGTKTYRFLKAACRIKQLMIVTMGCAEG